MTSLELTDKKEQLTLKAQNLLNAGKAEQRKLTDEETKEYNSICKEIADIEIELRDCTDGSIARFKAEVMDSPIFRFEVGYEFTRG